MVNKIKIGTTYFCRFKEEVYNNEDIIKVELKYKEVRDNDDGSITHHYSISIIIKEEKQIDIFIIKEQKKIDDMEGLNNLVNYLNSFIKNKREMY